MAEKRGRHFPGSSSFPPTEEEEEDNEDEANAQWASAIGALNQYGIFTQGKAPIYVRWGAPLRQTLFVLPGGITIEPFGNSFLWDGHLVASIDAQQPGELVLYMPRTGEGPRDPESVAFTIHRDSKRGYVKASDADVVARVYQYILRLLLSAQEAHANPQGSWTAINASTLPTMRAADPTFVEGLSRLSYMPIPHSPALLWPQDWVQHVEPVSAGGFACTVLQHHASGRSSLVRVTARADLNDNNLRIHHCLAKHFAPYVPLVMGPEIVQLGRLDQRVLHALRANEACTKFDWLAPKANHMNVSVSVMEYAELGDLHDYMHGNAIDWRIGLQILAFLYASQALLGFEHGDFKASNIVLTMAHGPHPTPQIIDFDMANFHPLKNPDPDRRQGSPWTAAPEFFDSTLGEARTVLGAADVWSYGVVMLGWRVGLPNLFHLRQPWVVTALQNSRRDTRAQNAIIQRILHDAGLPHDYQPMRDAYIMASPPNGPAVYKKLIKRLQSLSADEHAFFSQLFHPNPWERIQHGQLHKLLYHPLFDRHMSKAEQAAILQDAVYRHFPAAGGQMDLLPSTLNATNEQLCNLIGANYALGCIRCGSEMELFLCTQSKRVVCGGCA